MGSVISESHLYKSVITLILFAFDSQMGSPESHFYEIENALIVFEFDSEMAA